MKYTFGEAKRILVNACHSKMTDVGDKINTALEALCGLNPWEHEFLRQVIRISSVAPAISLPQGATGLVRACVNGRPVAMRGQDFQFLSGGPGDLEKVPYGYRRFADGIADLGSSPVWFQPPHPAGLRAVSSGTGQPDLTVRAVAANGDPLVISLAVQSPDAEPSYSVPVSSVVSVSVDSENASSYVELRVADERGERTLARYNPKIPVPEFRQYRLPDRDRMLMRPGEAYDILAEVQFEPVPLVDDSDIIPIPTLEPIKSMLLYEYSNQNLESEASDKYLSQAMQWVTRLNSARNTRQEGTVLNIQYAGSLGQLSEYFRNI